jgi:hypothetical protein
MRGLALLLSLASPASSSLRAQSTATVPASSAVYDRIEAVSAWYPVRGLFLGERPMSVRDAVRVVEALARRVDSAPAGERRVWALRQIAVLRDALDSTERRDTPVRWSWRASGEGTNARVERIAPNGLGGFDTSTQRFTGLKARRSSFDGALDGIPVDAAGMQLLPTLSAGGRAVAVVIEPMLSTPGAAADSGRWAPALHRGYARAVWRNAALRVGPDEIRWGQSRNGALFISGNAAPLHAITLGTDTPITLPWLLRHAGAFRLTGLLADLGAGYPDHARLAAWQGSIQPWTNFELGVAVVTHTGGSGGPPARFFERVVDLFPVIDALAPQHADLQISNKIAGGNLRIRVPRLSGLDFYYELAIDDFDGRRLRSSMVEDAGHLLGLRLPVMTRTGPLVARAEWQRTSLRLYEHAQFTAGYTFHQRLIGNPVGPNATTLLASLEGMPPSGASWRVEVADERRNPSIFSATSTAPADRGFRFVLDTLIPDFRRDRVTGWMERNLGPMTAGVTLGAARVWQSGGAKRTEWALQLALRRQFLRTF